MEHYVLEIALPQVDAEESADLDMPLSESEFLGAIKGLKSGK